MKTLRTRTKILLVSGLALLVPALVVAQAANKHLGMGMHDHGAIARHIAKELDLTPDQIQQIKTIFASHKAELTTELTAVKTDRGQLFDAIHATTLDENAIKTAAATVGTAEGNLAVTRAQVFGEVRQVLTPDQQTKLTGLLAHAKGMHESFFSMIQEHLNDPLAGI
jgi:Spy/CpxP family protein refolding chaperone